MRIQSILATPCLLTMSQKLGLAYLAQGLKPGATIVEVGPYRGGSTKILLESSGDARVHTIDLFDNIDRKLVGDMDRLTITIGGATRFAEIYDGPKIDMLFIDGDHSYYGVKHDFQTLRHLLANDAVIVFHDYNLTFIGVRMYCDALARAGIITDTVPVDGMLVCSHSGEHATFSHEDLLASVAANVEFERNRTDITPTNEWSCQDVDRMSTVLASINGDWKGIGKGSQGRYFAEFMGADFNAFIDSKEAEHGGKFAIFSHYHREISEFLQTERGVAPADIVAGKHLIAFAMYDDLVNNNGKRLIAASTDAGEKEFISVLSQQPQEFIYHLYCYGVFPRLFMRTDI